MFAKKKFISIDIDCNSKLQFFLAIRLFFSGDGCEKWKKIS